MAANQRSRSAGRSRGVACSAVASRAAARVSSRFSRARAGSPYLSLMTSPCSVTLMAPSRVPAGSDKMASWVGPPPRPTVPPRPWKNVTRTPWRWADLQDAALAPGGSPTGRW